MKDAWALFKQASDQGMVEANLLNNLLEVHMNTGRIGEMEGAVLPLYKQLKIEEDSWTYKSILVAYAES